MANVELKGVRKSYGDLEVIRGIDLDLKDREFIVFVGPSGCGKSTLLRMIAGLEEISAGDLLIDGARVNDVPPDARGLAMVFQSYALYPHMSVADNMSFALRLAGVPKAERLAKVNAAAKILQLEPLLARKPGQLSGGQRQRVAIGRAIVREPKVFLFDEPLSNLDAALRVQMRIELAKLHRSLSATMIYVTHDQVEAMTLADRIVVLNQGRVEQVGTPLELYHRPANLFVAGFIGNPKMNLTPVKIVRATGGAAQVALPSGGQLAIPNIDAKLASGAAATLGFRPDYVTLDPDGPFAGEVAAVEHLGGETICYVQCGADMVAMKLQGDVAQRSGVAVRLGVDLGKALLFDERGQAVNR